MSSMTVADLLALPPTVDLVTAARALGCGRTLAYDLARRGQFPCRVLRLGNRYLVPTAELLRTLGISSPADDAAERFRRTSPIRAFLRAGTGRDVLPDDGWS